jgi:TonB family protein
MCRAAATHQLQIMTMRKVARLFGAAAVFFGSSQCVAPPQRVSGGDEMSAELQTDLTAYRNDLISQLPPAYPTETHGHHYQGSGIYRVTFQYDSGRATSVAVIETAGQGVLDQAAIEALRKWKVRARSRHSIDVTVRFVANRATATSAPTRMRQFPTGAPTSFRPPHTRSP